MLVQERARKKQWLTRKKHLNNYYLDALFEFRVSLMSKLIGKFDSKFFPLFILDAEF